VIAPTRQLLAAPAASVALAVTVVVAVAANATSVVRSATLPATAPTEVLEVIVEASTTTAADVVRELPAIAAVDTDICLVTARRDRNATTVAKLVI